MPADTTIPFITVTIPSFKRTRQLELAVRSVMVQDYSADAFEIIVVDSSPTEDNLRMITALQQEFAGRLLCLCKEPEGPGPSRNLGAHTGQGSILAFMDSDCIASSDWLRGGAAAFQSETTGLVQGRTLPDPNVAHSVFSWSIQVEHESFLYETANIFYRKTAFDQAGGFLRDQRPHAERPLGGEDVDLAWKVKRLGWASCFAPDALVFHEVIRISKLRWFVNHRLYVLPKMIRAYPELRRFFPYRYFFDTIQVWTALALTGVLLSVLSPFCLILLVPYAVIRGSEPSQTLKGPLKLLRVLLYAPRDVASLLILIVGSIRFGALIL